VQVGAPLADGRVPITLLLGEIDRQALIDRLQAALGKSGDWRITIVPTDTVIPREESEEAGRKNGGDEEDSEESREARRKDEERASREELYHLVAAGSRTDSNFLLLVILSTVVATVGLEQDSITILIGAMVIAPLLGPNVAFSFGAAIGDQELMWDAVRTAVTGVALAIVVAGVIAFLIPPDLGSRELMARTTLDYAGIVLALASGAAAALSVTTGLSSTLVGVMVAVALLPPAATFGMMLAAREWYLATGAAMLLAGNVACVNLSAQVVFVAKGIKPRLWQERKNARRAMTISLATWLALIVVLVALIAVRQS
ncbi:MAG: TIGR00341 family protein, partial [Rhizobiales bacterium]|nr:TIGR00341 family protein [Hyphomicrobiales bacterium]